MKIQMSVILKKVNIQEALNIIEPVPLFDRTKMILKIMLERLEK